MNALAGQLPFRIAKTNPTPIIISLWALSMLSLPILRWVYGDNLLPLGVTVTVVLQVMAVLTILTQTWGIVRTVKIALSVVLLAWLIEFIGSSTGIPFGAYHYTPVLQPQLGGVPLIIPLAWLMLLPCAWAVGFCVARKRRWLFIVAAALAFTAWDLFLDPQMVNWGFWVWQSPSGYFGIPWVNFIGWLIAAALITTLVRPQPLPAQPLLTIYGLTWFFETIGLLVFWGLPGPALVGCLAMGSMLFTAIYRLRKSSPPCS